MEWLLRPKREWNVRAAERERGREVHWNELISIKAVMLVGELIVVLMNVRCLVVSHINCVSKELWIKRANSQRCDDVSCINCQIKIAEPQSPTTNTQLFWSPWHYVHSGLLQTRGGLLIPWILIQRRSTWRMEGCHLKDLQCPYWKVTMTSSAQYLKALRPKPHKELRNKEINNTS
jgi:hypothetical protein